MKKLLLILLVLSANLVSAQLIEPIKEYQIDTTGSVYNGLVLTSGFHICVDEINMEMTDSINRVSISAYTCQDSTHTVILDNDSISKNYEYNITQEQADTLEYLESIDILFRPRLVEVYGVNNVIDK